MIRGIVTECGVDFDEDSSAMLIDHTSFSVFDVDGNHTLIAADDLVKSDVILGKTKIEAPVLFRGVAHSLNPTNSLVFKVLSASPSAYSANPSSKLSSPPQLTGSAISLVSVMQARNNARVVISGSLQLFSDRSGVQKAGSQNQYEKSGNEQFVTELSKWVFHERGHLKAGSLVHHRVGETDEPAIYRIKDDLMGKGESELELGLGLSLGGGTAAKIGGKSGGGAWGERGRLLTAKDFPSVGSKRAADSPSHAGSSPPRSSQVVGWPPIGSHRMNSLVNNQATKSAREEEEAGKKKVNDDHQPKDVTKKVNGKVQLGFIKVNMDGVAIGRKVDLNAHSSYENLAQTLEDMFFRTNPGTIGLTGQFTKPLRLLDGSSEFVLTYEDKEGDWMLVGDVPWRMFITSVKRLRVMKTSEANGLAARHQEPKERQRNQPA